MKKIQSKDGVYTIELKEEELKLLASVLNEILDGPNAFDEDDWEMLIKWPREVAEKLNEDFDGILT